MPHQSRHHGRYQAYYCPILGSVHRRMGAVRATSHLACRSAHPFFWYRTRRLLLRQESLIPFISLGPVRGTLARAWVASAGSPGAPNRLSGWPTPTLAAVSSRSTPAAFDPPDRRNGFDAGTCELAYWGSCPSPECRTCYTSEHAEVQYNIRDD